MLIIEAKIKFHKNSLEKDLCTENILRPAFNFGGNWLFSGTIKAMGNESYFKLGEEYDVKVEFPTIEGEAREIAETLIYEDCTFTIQTGAKIIGSGVLYYYVFI